MAKGNGKKPGGDDGDQQNQLLIGTDLDDSLRAGKGDDELFGLAGNDSLNGGDGFDTAVFAGSAIDYVWEVGRRGKVTISDLNSSDGYEGVDQLSNIEALRFDDYTYYLDGTPNKPLVFVESQQTSVDQPVTFTVTSYDFGTFGSFPEITITGGARLYSRDYSSAEANMGEVHTVTITVDPSGVDYTGLAEGEVKTETITLKYYGHTETVEVAMVGINDAPELAGATVVAAEDGAAVSLDLSTLGFDVDSDDSGATLSYAILGLSEAANVTLDGNILSFDPGDGYQMLNAGDVHEITVTIQATDSHGAVSNSQQVVIAIEGRDDPRPDYQNPDGSVNYAALGVDPAGAVDHGTLSGIDGKASNLDLVGFSEDDDMDVVVADIIEIFGDHDFFYNAYGIELYDDLTFDTGAGSDTLVFYQHSEGDLAYLGLTDVRTGTGEDVVVVDSSASGTAWMEGVNIATGDHNDQILIRLESGASQIIEGGDFSTGAGNDLVSIELNETGAGQNGFSSIIMADFYLGDGNDELLIDINGKEAVWANVRADINAGAGDDHVVIDNSDTTMSETYPYSGFMMSGLDGDIYMGAGDDVLDIDVTALDGEGAEAILLGGEGHDILNLLGGAADDYTVAENYPGNYTVTTAGQTYYVNDFEEINLADGTPVV